MTEYQADGKTIRIYPAKQAAGAPVVLDNEYEENGSAILARCRKMSCRPFHLVTVSGVDWDRELSPWPSAPVASEEDRFTGQGPEYLHWLTEHVLPSAQEILQQEHPVCYITGYSLAGLFALWSLYETDIFHGAVSASGSMWYPEFEHFASTEPLKGSPDGIYLSLGRKESQVRNRLLQENETISRRLSEYYVSRGIYFVFELNPGNHYTEPDLRLAKGISWLLQDTAQ